MKYSYKGIDYNVYRGTIGGCYWYAFTTRGRVMADTLGGLKRMIREVMK